MIHPDRDFVPNNISLSAAALQQIAASRRLLRAGQL
jgi:hypothetical protein